MSNEFYAPGQQAGAVLYGVVRQAGTIYRTDSHVFEAPLAANWTSYAVSMAAQYSGATAYQGNFPTAIVTAGSYILEAYIQAGGSPASTDSLAASPVQVYWDGARVAAAPVPVDPNVALIKAKTDLLIFGAGGVNASVAGISAVGVNAYAGGPAVTVSNAAPTIHMFVARGTDDPVTLTHATSADTPISLAGQLLILHVKASRNDTDANAISHWASAAVSLNGTVYTNCITLADQTANPGQFTVSPPKTETADTSKYPDRQSRFYSIKTFGTGQGFIARGTFTVGTETVNSIVSPT